MKEANKVSHKQRKTKPRKGQSLKRKQKAELKETIEPALKVVLPFISSTPQMGASFLGHKVKAGNYTDEYGRVWQLQVHVVCSKKQQIPEDQAAVIPMFSKWDVRLKLRAVIKYFLDWTK